MKKTTVLALVGGATVVVGALGAIRESNRFLTGLRDEHRMGSITDALWNATTDDEIIACVLAYIRSETESIEVRPAYQPVLKFGPASVLLRTRRPLCNAQTATLYLLKEVFESIAKSGGPYMLSDRAAHLIVLGTLDLVQEYADAQAERNTRYRQAMDDRLERLDPFFDAVGNAIKLVRSLKQRANGMAEPVIRRLHRA